MTVKEKQHWISRPGLAFRREEEERRRWAGVERVEVVRTALRVKLIGREHRGNEEMVS
jgi:hypothetical protein